LETAFRLLFKETLPGEPFIESPRENREATLSILFDVLRVISNNPSLTIAAIDDHNSLAFLEHRVCPLAHGHNPTSV
jgi:hypothetical protein